MSGCPVHDPTPKLTAKEPLLDDMIGRVLEKRDAQIRRKAFEEAAERANRWWEKLSPRDRCTLTALQDLKDCYHALAKEKL